MLPLSTALARSRADSVHGPAPPCGSLPQLRPEEGRVGGKAGKAGEVRGFTTDFSLGQFFAVAALYGPLWKARPPFPDFFAPSHPQQNVPPRFLLCRRASEAGQAEPERPGLWAHGRDLAAGAPSPVLGSPF